MNRSPLTASIIFTLLILGLCSPAWAQEAPPPDLSTPRRSLENFIFASRAGDDALAARSLDLSHLRESERAERGPELARRLKFVLDQELWVVWSDVPDREMPLATPPGQAGVDGAVPTFELGEARAMGRRVAITMTRVEGTGGALAWLISADTVAKVPMLYAEHGIGPLVDVIPRWMQTARFLEIVLWQWLAMALFVLVAVLLGRLLQAATLRALRKSLPAALHDRRDEAASYLRGPVALLSSALLLTLTAPLLRLSDPVRPRVESILFVAIILGVLWLTTRSVALFSKVFAQQHTERLRAIDAVRARSFETQVVVAGRVINFILVLVALGVGLYQVDVLRTVGTSLLASAGLAGIVLGLAAQRTLSNILAGIQLALSQPVRIGDSVVFEGEWGWIEEITFTYVVIRIWDLRRLVVPINYLLERPIQNWTRTSNKLLGTVFINCDYSVDVEELRAELRRIVSGSDLWTGEVAGLQVTDCRERVLEVRAIASAPDAGSAWDLRCHMREKLIEYLRLKDGGAHLPRARVDLQQQSEKEPEGEASFVASEARENRLNAQEIGEDDARAHAGD